MATSTAPAVTPPMATPSAFSEISMSCSRTAPSPAMAANAAAVFASIMSAVSRATITGLALSRLVRSTAPVSFVGPRINSMSEKVCFRRSMATVERKPAAGNVRTASSTSFDSHAAKPVGCLTANSRLPSKRGASPPVRRPSASSVERPGNCAEADRMRQSLPSGRADNFRSRIVVFPATTAGRLMSTDPGMDGSGISPSVSSMSCNRSPNVLPPVAPFTSSATSNCCPVASIKKRGSAPRSTNAEPSAEYGSASGPDSKRNSSTSNRVLVSRNLPVALLRADCGSARAVLPSPSRNSACTPGTPAIRNSPE